MFEEQEKNQEIETQQETEPYSFVQETVKDEQKNPKKLFADIWKTAVRGIIFGAGACLAFCALKPWVENRLSGNTVVSIPQDEEGDNMTEEDGTKEENQENTSPVLTLDNYRELSGAMNQTAAAAAKSVVEVRGISGEESWNSQDEAAESTVSGVVFADTGSEMLILAPSRAAAQAEHIKVAFSDRSVCEGTVKKQDKNIGIAVYAVAKNALNSTTANQITTAVLGNSNVTGKGDSVIAVGRQFGYSGGLGYGIVSSARNKTRVADGEFSLLCADIPAASGESGILFNLDGEVVGLVDQTLSGGGGDFVTAYAISGLKTYIELLSNGNAVPYIGIRGIEVNSAIAEEEGIPEGLYVQEAEADSPAMQVGIQSGDIITSVAGKEISTLTGYKNILAECKTGQEIRIRGKRQGSSGYVDISFQVTVGSKE